MPKVASDVKIAAHIGPRTPSRQSEQDDENPFSAVLDSVAPEKPASKADRAAPAKESRRSEPSDPRAPKDDPAPSSDAAPQESSPTAGEEAAAPVEAKAETDIPAKQTEADPATADLAAIIDATLVMPVAQPVQAAPVVAAPALAPVDVVPVDNAEIIPAIAAAAAAQVPAKAIAAPATADTDEAGDTQDAPKVAAPTGTQADGINPKDILANKQAQDGKPGEHQITAPQGDAANAAPAKPGKAEPAADLEHSLKAAQPAANTPDNAPTLPLSSLHAHATVQTAAAQPTPQVANSVPVSGIAFEIAAQAKAGGTRFEIRLDPPELGRIDVRLEVDKNGQVTSHLRVDRVETLDMLRRDSANLERALQDAGLKTSDNALNFSLRDQSQQQQAREQNTPSSQQYIATDDSMSAIGGTQVSAWASRLGGIDIRV